MKILWQSQHRPLPVQIAWLKKRFGTQTEVVQCSEPFSSAEEIVRRFRDGNFDEMVVVAPLSVIARLVDLGSRPLWCQMDQVGADEPHDLIYRGRHYRFAGFKRVKMVRLEFDDEL